MNTPYLLSPALLYLNENVVVALVLAGLKSTESRNGYNSTVVGTGYLRNFVYDYSTSDSDANTYVYKAYVHDIQNAVLTGNVSTATANTITFPGTYSTSSGGWCNITNARHSVIAGGQRNTIQSPTNECCSLGVTIGGGIGHNSSGGTLSATTTNRTTYTTCSIWATTTNKWIYSRCSISKSQSYCWTYSTTTYNCWT